MGNNIYCTLVFDNIEYILGAVTLAQSLRRVGAKYPIWCMYANIDEFSKKILETHFDKIVEVPILSQDVPDMPTVKQQNIYGHWIKKSFTKWNCMNPQILPVDKVLFIDADMIFKENPDELFELSTPACIFDFPYSRDVNKGGPINYFNNNRVPYEHGQHAVKKHLQLCLNKGWHGILGAMVLLSPSKSLYKVMIDEFNNYLENSIVKKPICGADEQLLGRIIYRLFDKYTPSHIHKKYCFHVGKYKWYDGPIVGQHYCSAHPWNMERGSWNDVDEWYEIFDKLCTTDDKLLTLHNAVKSIKNMKMNLNYSVLDAS